MSETIEPALTPEEWAEYRRRGGLSVTLYPAGGMLLLGLRPAVQMAIANDSLGDDDPLKITREDVALLAAAASPLWDQEMAAMRRLAAKLAALLPPRDPA